MTTAAIKPGTTIYKAMVDIEAATIERCAQVADEYKKLEPRQAIVAEKIAAAIRKLRDEK